jgi:hypothetical protein
VRKESIATAQPLWFLQHHTAQPDADSDQQTQSLESSTLHTARCGTVCIEASEIINPFPPEFPKHKIFSNCPTQFSSVFYF